MSWGGKNSGNNDNGPWGRPRPGGNNSGGGSNNGGGGGRKTPPGQDHDLEELFRKSQDHFKGMFGGGSGNGDAQDSKKSLIVIGAILLLIWLFSGVYRVDADEQGVELMFGKFHESTSPGLHYHLPYPIQQVFTPSVTTINKVEVRGRDGGAMRGTEDNRMLAGDLNLVDINFDVQWKINPNKTADFLFNIREPVETIRPVAESVMREVIGQMKLAYIIDRGQAQIAERSARTIQEVLDGYEAGITIVGVNLRKPDVPDEVIDAYQDVKKAEQDLETEVSKANRYQNQIIPTAKGKAVQMEQQALAYREEVIAEAKGQASRFSSVFEEYRQAKDITRKRLYLETMEKILADMPKIIIDEKAGKGVVPYLPLPELNNKRLEKGN